MRDSARAAGRLQLGLRLDRPGVSRASAIDYSSNIEYTHGARLDELVLASDGANRVLVGDVADTVVAALSDAAVDGVHQAIAIHEGAQQGWEWGQFGWSVVGGTGK